MDSDFKKQKIVRVKKATRILEISDLKHVTHFLMLFFVCNILGIKICDVLPTKNGIRYKKVHPLIVK